MRFFPFFLALFVVTLAVVRAEIPVKGKFSTDYRKAKRKIWGRMADEYQRRSKDDPTVKRLVVKLICDYADQIYIIKGFRSLAEIADDARKIAAMDLSDPFAKSVIGVVILLGGNDRVSDFVLAEGLLQEGIEGIENTQYSILVKMHAARWRTIALRRSRKINGPAERKIWKNFADKTYAWFSAKHPEEEVRFVWECSDLFSFFYRTKDSKMRQNFVDKVSASARIKPWLKEMTLGKYFSVRVRFVRMGANGKRINDPLPYRERVELARKHLTAAHRLHPDRPEAAVGMILIASDARHWFDQAVKVEVDNSNAYRAYITALRNHANYEELASFGKECVATGLYNTIIPGSYIRISEILLRRNGSFSDSQGQRQYLDLYKVLREYEKREEQGDYAYGQKKYIRAIHFFFAFKCHRFDHVVKLHKVYGNSVFVPALFRGFGIDYRTDLGLAFAMNGPASKIVPELDTQMNWETTFERRPFTWRSAKEVDDLIAKLKKARSMTTANEAKPYFDKLAALLAIEKKFNEGGWVDLKFPKDLSTWHVYGGHFSVENDHSVLASNTDNQKQYISSNAFFRPPYTVEVEVESIRSNWRGNHLQAGIICGRVSSGNTGRVFWVDGLRKRTGMGVPVELPRGIDLKSMRRKNKLRLNVWTGYHERFVNDAYSEPQEDPKFIPLRLGLGIMPWYYVSGVARYSNFRIRKIDYDRPPKNEDRNMHKRIAYFKERLSQENQDHRDLSLNQLAFAYWIVGENEGSIEGYRKAFDYFKQAAQVNSVDFRNPLFAIWTGSYLRKYDELQQLYPEVLKRVGTRNKRFKVREARFYASYAWHCATCPVEKYRDPVKAVDYARRALKLNKEQSEMPNFMDVLCCALAANGDFEGAVATAQKALAQFGPSKEDYRKKMNRRIQLFKQRKVYLSSLKERTSCKE